jgi:hypothetical protein
MKLFFPYPSSEGGYTATIKMRLISEADLATHPIETAAHEVVISKDYQTGEILLASHIGGKKHYEGRMYEKLIQLDISQNVDEDLTAADKTNILDFVSQFSCPLPTPLNLWINMRSDPFKSKREEGDEINWLFIPYESKPLDQSRVSFFYDFRNAYNDFLNCFEAVKNNDSGKLKRYEGVFNMHLKNSHLYLTRNGGKAYSISWISNTCLDLCYLELYSLLISNQSIKVCKYCSSYFESSKSNELRCKECKKPEIYRTIYYEKNKPTEQLKARERMKKLRKLQKNI